MNAIVLLTLSAPGYPPDRRVFGPFVDQVKAAEWIAKVEPEFENASWETMNVLPPFGEVKYND